MGRLLNAIIGGDEKPVQAIPLEHAVLCMNCETVFDVTERACPVCCSEVYLNVGIALGDEETRSRVRDLAVAR
jgi:rRNA maturation endonuclease Nob1